MIMVQRVNVDHPAVQLLQLLFSLSPVRSVSCVWTGLPYWKNRLLKQIWDTSQTLTTNKPRIIFLATKKSGKKRTLDPLKSVTQLLPY